MNMEQFEDCLDKHGSDIGRWPRDLAVAAQRLLAGSELARTARGEARGMDRLLRDALQTYEPEGLKQRILAKVAADAGAADAPNLRPSELESGAPRGDERSREHSWVDWLTAAIWRPVALAMIPLSLGFAAGLNFPEVDGSDLEDAVVLMAFTDTIIESYEDDSYAQ
ncbi:MAG: hypothetical protein O7H39_06635 [Gammaproteobacteria bacterium]|nr:hypothetical protein [Gammaproteobacteria bacterium]